MNKKNNERVNEKNNERVNEKDRERVNEKDRDSIDGKVLSNTTIKQTYDYKEIHQSSHPSLSLSLSLCLTCFS